MAPRKTKSAGQAPAATQPPSTSASAPAALADREGGASTAASSNGVEDQVVAGAVSAAAGGDQPQLSEPNPEGGAVAAATVVTTSEEALTSSSDGAAAATAASNDPQAPTGGDAIVVVGGAGAEPVFIGADFASGPDVTAYAPVNIALPTDADLRRDLTAITLAAQPSPNSAPQGLDQVSAEQPTSSTDAEAAPIDHGDLIAIEGRSRDDRPYRRAGIVWTSDWVEHLVTVAQSERLDADRHVQIRYL